MTKQRSHPNTNNAEPTSTRVRSALTATITSPTGRLAIAGLTLLLLATTPVAAQQLGEVYCSPDGPGIDDIIDTFFSAMLGLGLPASLGYTGLSGFRYMRAGGNPDKEREAKQKLYYGVAGLFIIMMVIILPEIADKLFGVVGAGFSDCVKPF